jgi:hypothetical protein
VIRIDCYNSSGSDYVFEFRLCNEYIISPFELDGGADCVNSYAKKLHKGNHGLYLLHWGNCNSVHDSYQPLDNNDLSNIFFHWDITESDT